MTSEEEIYKVLSASMDILEDNTTEEVSSGAHSQSPGDAFRSRISPNECIKSEKHAKNSCWNMEDDAIRCKNNTDSPINKSEEEKLLKQLLVAIDRLSSSLESMDKTNSAMLRALIGLTIKEATPSPKPIPHWAFEDTTTKVNKVFKNEDKKGKGIFIADDTGVHKDAFKKLKDVSTIMISSDEEERVKKQQQPPSGLYVRGSQVGSKRAQEGNKVDPFEGIEDHNDEGVKPFSSNYRDSLQGQVCPGHEANLPSVRKLTFTTTQSERVNKRSKAVTTGTTKRPSPSKKQSKGGASVKIVGQSVPKHVPCKFRPIPTMKLSPIATNVALYVFQAKLEPSEVLFTVGIHEGTRADFDSLCPSKKVSREIILMTTLKITCDQLKNEIPSVWCLPLSFADDVDIGSTTNELIHFYERDWMGCYDHLRLVYLPIIDNYGHWFLMVISIRDRRIYLMDSCLPDIVLDSRRVIIHKQATALSTMIPHMYEGQLSKTKDLDFAKYDIEQAKGVPKCVNSDTSGLWVAEWMHMQNNFTNNGIGVVDENHVRMEVAMRLLLDDNNEKKMELIQKSAEYWLQVTASPII